MDARRWQSPAAAAAAAEAAAEDASGGGGGPSRRPPRRGLHRASPYGLGPRRWLPKPPVASSVFPAASRDHAAAGISSPPPLLCSAIDTNLGLYKHRNSLPIRSILADLFMPENFILFYLFD